MRGDGRATRRDATAVLPSALALALLCSAWVGCTGPGLEPPWGDTNGSGRSSTQAGSAPPPTVAPPPPGGGDFGNPSMNTAGAAAPPSETNNDDPDDSTVTPPVTPPTTPTGGAAGTGSTPPTAGAGGSPSMSDAGATAMPGGPPGDPGNPLTGVDFVPDCETEAPAVLESSAMCRYPLPDGLDPSQVEIATLDGTTALLLARHDDAFGCLLGGGYYVDASVVPALIVVCSQTCAQLPDTAQVIAIDGCGTP